MRLIGFADDICQNDEPSHAVAAYSGPKGLLEAQKKGASVFDGVSKSLIYSPEGDLSCAPGWLRGSPAHRDKEGKPTGRVDCFKAVGTFFGDPEACKKELTAHLRKKLAPLDVIDTIVDTDCVTNTSHAAPPQPRPTDCLRKDQVHCRHHAAQCRVRRSRVCAQPHPQVL